MTKNHQPDWYLTREVRGSIKQIGESLNEEVEDIDGRVYKNSLFMENVPRPCANRREGGQNIVGEPGQDGDPGFEVGVLDLVGEVGLVVCYGLQEEISQCGRRVRRRGTLKR